MLLASVGLLLAYSALPRARTGDVTLETAGDLIREAQHMKVRSWLHAYQALRFLN
jgi:hypothetical protein